MSKVPTNVLLITIDCLRADHVGIYGYSRPTTPNIDEIARKGIVFTQAIANGPDTLSSFPSILTSSYPMMYGGHFYLSDKRTTVAETLKKNGLATAAFHSNPYLMESRNYGRGFDTFWDGLETTSNIARIAPKVRTLIRNQNLINLLIRIASPLVTKKDTTPYARGDQINEKAKEWLKTNDEPFFLWTHYMDAHFPYLPLEEYRRKFCSLRLSHKELSDIFKRKAIDPLSLSDDEVSALLDLYDAEINYADKCVGELVKHLEKQGYLDRTLIVILADHGEQFREHGSFGHGKKNALYDEILHVPLIFYCPSILTSPAKIEEQVELIDVPPTVTDLLGFKKVNNWHGETLLPLIKGTGERKNKTAFSAFQSKKYKFISARTSEWKFIHDEKTNEHKLYNLKSDPLERTNLYNKHIDLSKQFEKAIEKHIQEAEQSQVSLPKVKLDEEVKDRLRGLGYMD